ncbi:MAG: UV DNA damage repair endonuclease UvsE [Candidatus Woesearchaeota archaeon]
MKIGYPCINWTAKLSTNHSFKLASYNEEKLFNTIQSNLDDLKEILEYNVENNLLYFRIGSQFVPFASHEVCKSNWVKEFKQQFQEIGNYIKQNNIRIAMHPDQFVLINAKDNNIVERSIKELDYHAKILDAMKLDETAKIQIHIGGVYGDKSSAIQRFIDNYKKLPENIKKRLAIENDDKLFSLKDCLEVNKATKIPIIFDTFHHECLNNNESMVEAIKLAGNTWQKKDGVLLIDYSSQQENERKGKHTKSIDINHFKKILKYIQDSKTNPDIMLEIKDKETSALQALTYLI